MFFCLVGCFGFLHLSCWSCLFTALLPPVIPHTSLNHPPNMQASFNLFHFYFHWLCFLSSDVLSKSFPHNLPPFLMHVPSPQPNTTGTLHTCHPGAPHLQALPWLSFYLGCFPIWKTHISLLRHSSNIAIFTVVSVDASGWIHLLSPLDPNAPKPFGV